MKIAVTGHLGYIGSDIFNKLVNEQQVIIETLTGIDRVHGDHIQDYVLNDTYDYVIHLAADISVPESEINPEKYYLNNCVNYQKFLDKNRGKIKNIILASTQSVYAPTADGGVTVFPQSTYSITKLTSELITRKYCTEEKMPDPAVLRFANPVGISPYHNPRRRFHTNSYPNMMWILANRIIDGKVFNIHNLPGMTRDFYPLSLIYSNIRHIIGGGSFDYITNIGSGTRLEVVPLLIAMCQEHNIEYALTEPPAGTSLGIDVSKLSNKFKLDETSIKIMLNMELDGYVNYIRNSEATTNASISTD